MAPLHKDPTQEPFIDVAIGGTHVPNARAGTLCVWAITAHGRAMFRTGVTQCAPEVFVGLLSIHPPAVSSRKLA